MTNILAITIYGGVCLYAYLFVYAIATFISKVAEKIGEKYIKRSLTENISKACLSLYTMAEVGEIYTMSTRTHKPYHFKGINGEVNDECGICWHIMNKTHEEPDLHRDIPLAIVLYNYDHPVIVFTKKYTIKWAYPRKNGVYNINYSALGITHDDIMLTTDSYKYSDDVPEKFHKFAIVKYTEENLRKIVGRNAHIVATRIANAKKSAIKYKIKHICKENV